jgi:radical SAM superfamily enzyme YgiQ (UPF0313 family)
MKILFVSRIVEYIDPMNIELLSALARRAGHATFLSLLSEDDLGGELRRIRPDVVAFSAMTGEQRYFVQAAQVAKRYSQNIFTVIGGPHCTFFPEIVERPEFDAVGSGECDDAWPALLGALENGEDMNSIPNIFTKENWFGRFRILDSRGRAGHFGRRTTNLDALPFFDRELVYSKTHLKDFPMRSFMSSRGCPYECTYCFEPQFNILYRGKGPIFNRYSVRRLCAELKELRERWPTQLIKFYDDLFFIRKTIDPWLEEFAEVFPREVGLPFFCLARCNILTEDILKLLKKAGLHSMTMSIEAGNDYIRNKILKRRMTREEIIRAFRLCEKHGVVTFANTMFGIPVRPEIMAEQGRTAIDYDIESVRINMECRTTFAEFGSIYPYWGCELAEYVQSNGWFKPEDFEKLHFSYQSDSPFNCFTAKEKMAQKNLAFLGTVCTAFPWLYKPAVKFLIKLPLTRFYFVLYFFTKGYLNIFKVYPIRLGFANLIRNILRGFRIEWKKRSPGKELYKK